MLVRRDARHRPRTSVRCDQNARRSRSDAPATCESTTVYLVIELSKAKWKLGVMLRRGTADVTRTDV